MLSPRKYILILFILAGCVPMSEIEILVMDPAQVTFPLDVQQLVFLDRSVYPRLSQHDTAKWTDEEYHILDTILGTWIFQGVRSTMLESPLFDIDTIRIIKARHPLRQFSSLAQMGFSTGGFSVSISGISETTFSS